MAVVLILIDSMRNELFNLFDVISFGIENRMNASQLDEYRISVPELYQSIISTFGV